ncbi:MAG: hypothetical protein ABEH78_00880 [Haloferacaceae archaeon]
MSDGNRGSGLLARLRDWLGSLFGGGESATGPGEGAAAAGTCAVCGTPVEDPESGCPLCGSTDVESSDEGAGEGADDEGPPGSGPGPERRSMEDTADDAAARLRDVRGEMSDDGGAGDPSGPDAEATAADEGDPATDDGTADGAGGRRAGDG